MRTLLKASGLIFLFLASTAIAQSSGPKWKPIVIKDSKRIWYDSASVVHAGQNKIDVWMLETYDHPLTFVQIPGKIYRSKTLYTIDLNRATYGIKKVDYYNIDNREIYNHDYKIEDYPDSIKYSYPILENSPLHLLLRDLFKNKKKATN
ncbi:MAG: hypothetical protein ACYDA4_03515 [Ignavibacteriaceae bacterium]